MQSQSCPCTYVCIFCKHVRQCVNNVCKNVVLLVFQILHILTSLRTFLDSNFIFKQKSRFDSSFAVWYRHNVKVLYTFIYWLHCKSKTNFAEDSLFTKEIPRLNLKLYIFLQKTLFHNSTAKVGTHYFPISHYLFIFCTIIYYDFYGF